MATLPSTTPEHIFSGDKKTIPILTQPDSDTLVDYKATCRNRCLTQLGILTTHITAEYHFRNHAYFSKARTQINALQQLADSLLDKEINELELRSLFHKAAADLNIALGKCKSVYKHGIFMHFQKSEGENPEHDLPKILFGALLKLLNLTLNNDHIVSDQSRNDTYQRIKEVAILMGIIDFIEGLDEDGFKLLSEAITIANTTATLDRLRWEDHLETACESSVKLYHMTKFLLHLAHPDQFDLTPESSKSAKKSPFRETTALAAHPLIFSAHRWYCFVFQNVHENSASTTLENAITQTQTTLTDTPQAYDPILDHMKPFLLTATALVEALPPSRSEHPPASLAFGSGTGSGSSPHTLRADTSPSSPADGETKSETPR